MPTSIDEISFLLAQEKAKVFLELNELEKAELELFKALDIAMKAAEEGAYKDALRLFHQLLQRLEQASFFQSAWAEIYTFIAICYHNLEDHEKAWTFWTKAQSLEPNNEELRQIARRRGWLK